MPKDVPYNVSLKGVTKVRPTIRRRLSNHGAALVQCAHAIEEDLQMTNEELQKEMIAAMKAKDKVRLSIIRR